MDQDRRADKKSELLEHLHNPSQLRLIVAGVVLAIGYAAIYLPFDKSIATATRQLQEARTRLSLAQDVERLREQFEQVQDHLPPQTDANEWMQYVLGGIRQSPLKLESFSPGVSQPLGTYQVVSFTLKLSGSYADLDHFLHWLESNPRLIRVNKVTMNKAADGTTNMDVIVMGVIS